MSSGNGSAAGCSWACSGGYYEKDGTCALTPLGEYSPARNNDKFDCNEIPTENAAYIIRGEKTVACHWKCVLGYIISDAVTDGSPSAKTCVQNNTLAGIESFLIFDIAYTPATLSASWPRRDLWCGNNSNTVYLRKALALNSDNNPLGFIFYERNNQDAHPRVNMSLLRNREWKIIERFRSIIAFKTGATDSSFDVTRDGSNLVLKAPKNTGTKWNGRKLRLLFQKTDFCYPGVADPQTFASSFAGGSSAYKAATLEISDCLAASAANHTLTIDGVDIDLGSSAFSTADIAAAIENTAFSGGTLYGTHPYTVTSTADNGSGVSTVTFTLNSPSSNPTQPLQIEVDDSSYTKVSCSDSSVTSSTSTPPAFSITSTDFTHNGVIPSEFSNNIDYMGAKQCNGQNNFPQLSWSNVPAGTQKFVLIVDDPDAASLNGSDAWVHLNLFDIPAATTSIAKITAQNHVATFPVALGTLGQNDWNRAAWGGPCPPNTGDATADTHSYRFKVYAISSASLSPVPTGALTRSEFETTYSGVILDSAEMIGKVATTESPPSS